VFPEVVDPHLGREEQLFPGDGGGVYPSSDRGLVAVGLCGVDVTIARLEGGRDARCTPVGVGVLPGAESEHRHAVGSGHVVGRNLRVHLVRINVRSGTR